MSLFANAKLNFIRMIGILLVFSIFSHAIFKFYRFTQESSWLYLFVFLFLSALFADFITGLVHWLADTYGHPTWPLVGPTIIYHFRNHHDDPNSILKHDFVETNLSALVLSSLVSLSLVPFQNPIIVFLTWLCFFTGLTNQFHKWAHTTNPPQPYHFLARNGMVLSESNHLSHHSGDYKKSYCITLGWLNPVLDKINFFRFLEKLIFLFFNTKPHN